MALSVDMVAQFVRGVDLAGVLANAILGGIAARRARLDPVGFVALAILSGLGGGMIRDTLLQHGTAVALTDPAYLSLAIAGALIAFITSLERRWTQTTLVIIDALAIGCWAASGVQKALAADLSWLPAILLGTITAVGGGMVRDVLLMKVPTIFGGNTLYATSALIASLEVLILSKLGMPTLGTALAMLSGALVSILARRFGWRLPTGMRLSQEVRRLLHRDEPADTTSVPRP